LCPHLRRLPARFQETGESGIERQTKIQKFGKAAQRILADGFVIRFDLKDEIADLVEATGDDSALPLVDKSRQSRVGIDEDA
jgi:hypothetical protein